MNVLRSIGDVLYLVGKDCLLLLGVVALVCLICIGVRILIGVFRG